MRHHCRRIRLAVLDVDGVITPVRSSWGFIHRALGVEGEARVWMELFEKGLIGYWEWMFLDTLLWVEASPGISRHTLRRIFSSISLCPRAQDAVELLRRNGVEVALLSGGIDVFVEEVAKKLGVKHWYANKLVFDPWGRLVPGGFPLVEAGRKDKVLKRIWRELGFSPRETAFIGDSRWDYEAMRESCLAILIDRGERVGEVDYIARDVYDAARYIVECCRG